MSDTSRTEQIKQLTTELENVLSKMSKLGELQFHDEDCEGCLYNYYGVEISGNKVYIRLRMWDSKKL